MLSAIFSAILIFIATNIDDILVLMLFYSTLDQSARPISIVIGQYLGSIALITVSLVGFAGSYFLPGELIGSLGLAPIGIGIARIIRNKAPALPAESDASPNECKKTGKANPLPISVALVTFANGGDNIGVFTPYFASIDLMRVIVSIVVFLALVPVWCSLSSKLARQKHVAFAFSRYGDIIVPFVLIALGVSILAKGGTIGWAFRYFGGR